MKFKPNDKVIFCGPIVPSSDDGLYTKYLNKIFTIAYLDHTTDTFGDCYRIKENLFRPYECELKLADSQLMLFEL